MGFTGVKFHPYKVITLVNGLVYKWLTGWLFHPDTSGVKRAPTYETVFFLGQLLCGGVNQPSCVICVGQHINT